VIGLDVPEGEVASQKTSLLKKFRSKIAISRTISDLPEFKLDVGGGMTAPRLSCLIWRCKQIF